MKRKSGLTLMELLIAISFLGLVVLSAVAINTTANRFLTTQNNQVRVANQAENTLELIAKDIMLSFGEPGNEAFNIFDPGPISGNELKLRRVDVAPEGADANDILSAYRYDGATNSIEFKADLWGPVDWVTIARNIVIINPIFQAIDVNGDGNALNDNLIRVEITCRQDPSQPASVNNSEVTVATAVRIPSSSP